MIATFYSYKGGVGRSMAVANIAQWLSLQGVDVLIIDWDLEAPGIENYFFNSEDELDEVRAKPGLMELLEDYQTEFVRAMKRGAARSRGGVFDQVMESISIEKYLQNVQKSTATDGKARMGNLWLLSAGSRFRAGGQGSAVTAKTPQQVQEAVKQRVGEQAPTLDDFVEVLGTASEGPGRTFIEYAAAVHAFDWSSFLNELEGERFLTSLAGSFTRKWAQIVLIDSRTGITEMSGICTRLLADVVVSFSAANRQNLQGVVKLSRTFRRPDVLKRRDNKPEVMLVPSRVDDRAETEELKSFRSDFEKEEPAFPTKVFPFQKGDAGYWKLLIPYFAKFSYQECLTFRAPGSRALIIEVPDMQEVYQRLATCLVLHAPEDSPLRRTLSAVVVSRATHAKVMVLCTPESKTFAFWVSSRLREEQIPLGDPVELDPAPAAIDRAIALLRTAKAVVLAAESSNPLAGTAVRRVLRFAREQGKCVCIAHSGGNSQAPPWTSTYDTRSEWPKLAAFLRSSCEAARAPILAPPVPSAYVERTRLQTALREALVSAADTDRTTIIGLWGPAGFGKTALAERICADDTILDLFPGGVLWFSMSRPLPQKDALAKDPTLFDQLNRAWTALTGETTVASTEEQAASRLSERMSGRQCLIVADDLWRAEDWKKLPGLSSSSTGLITTRDREVAATVGAVCITVAEMTDEESAGLLAGSSGHPAAFAGPAAEEISGLAAQLYHWPLALSLARIWLTTSAVGAASPTALNQALERHGITAFDPQGVANRDSVFQRLKETLAQLKDEEKRDFYILARNPADYFKLERSEVQRANLMRRMANLALISTDDRGQFRAVHPVVLKFMEAQALLAPSAKIELAERNVSSSRTLRRKADAQAEVATVRNALLNNSVNEDLAGARKLVKTLKDKRFFGLGRQYLAMARRKFPDNYWLGKEHIVCTYKDPDLPFESRLQRALAILQEVDPPAQSNQSETLGIAGAIHKNYWYLDGQRKHLEDAYAFYGRGYAIEKAMSSTPPDRYCGINAAFVLDLLMNEERGGSDILSPGTHERIEEARRIREEIRAVSLAAIRDSSQSGGTQQWWFLVTLAEACFGLGRDENGAPVEVRYEETRYWIREALATPHSDWEFESFARQLANIARLHEKEPPDPDSPVAATLRVLIGDNELALHSLRAGKTGLALSGGGFRASLFHIGVLARLAELDILRHIEAISCVSGGSIVGAYYYLEVQRLLESKRDDEITREDYVEIVRNLERGFLAGVQTDLRNSLFAEFGTSWRSILFRGQSHTRRMGEFFEERIYARVQDGKGSKPRTLPDLVIEPKGAREDFAPKLDNWRRAAKAPVLVLNATTLNTGHNWQFTASWMGEPPSGINTEIDVNSRLRRMYYWQAPERYQQLRLGYAVAASAAVPLLFDPLDLPELYERQTVQLSDGGVHDNQGISALLGEDCTILLVSDASGQLTTRREPSGGHGSVLFRANDILQERIRGIEFRQAQALQRSRVVRSLMFIHLTKDLDGSNVPWLGEAPPSEPPDVRLESRDPFRTNYGILRSVQRSLARLRTDLDSFTEREARALMLSGYRMTRHEFPRCVSAYRLPAEERPVEWEFIALNRALANTGRDSAPEFEEQLEVGAQVFGKTMALLPGLRRTLKVLTTVLLLEIVALAVVVGRKAPLLLLLTIIASAVGLGVIMRWFFRRQGKSPSQVAIGLALGCGGFLAFRIYLGLLAPWYLAWGSTRAESTPRSAAKPTLAVAGLMLVLILSIGVLVWVSAGRWMSGGIQGFFSLF